MYDVPLLSHSLRTNTGPRIDFFDRLLAGSWDNYVLFDLDGICDFMQWLGFKVNFAKILNKW